MKNLNGIDIDRIIEMAWEDRTTFDAIFEIFGLKESEVISIMRKNLKPPSFRLWRKRVSGRKTKHQAKRNFQLEDSKENCKHMVQIEPSMRTSRKIRKSEMVRPHCMLQWKTGICWRRGHC